MSSIFGRSSAPQPPDDDHKPRSARRHARYEDDFDSTERPGVENPTSAGMIGFVFSLVSLGLLVVVAVLWVLLDQDQRQMQDANQKRWMLYWFLFLDVLSFFASLVATIMGGRGLTPSNPLHRGFSMTALILGLLLVVATMIFGIFMTCFVTIFVAIGAK